MPNNGRVTVTNIDKTEIYELNGVVRNVADAIGKFTGGRPFEGAVKVGGREVADMQTPLREGDVVLLLNTAVAGGGIKGAAC